jgi:pimeloyl-ACP methyl ester carboxylesterase
MARRPTGVAAVHARLGAQPHLALAALSLVVACSGSPSAPVVPRPPPTRSSTTTTTATYAPPRLSWAPCGSLQCAILDVPLDYGAVRGPHIGIALSRHLASEPAARIGSLVLNPGGPGESGLLNMGKDLSLLPAGVLARFDVVAFDPRGIGKSSPVSCSGDTYNGPTPDPVPQTADARAVLVTSDRAYAAACVHTSGALLLAHVGSVDVARDLESLRIAVGDRGLTYLGLSYGTLLGATYAGMFPTHVRAMVLDGAIDPSLTTADLAAAQSAGFERALASFFSWCSSSGGCVWHPGPNARAAFDGLAAAVRAHPIAVGSRSVGPTEFYTGTFGTLYAVSFWPSLGRALAGLAAGNGSGMLGLYDSYEHAGDPSFNGDANSAITCLDHPVSRDLSSYPALAAAAAANAPDFGPLFAWGAVECAVWPVPFSRTVAPVHAAGSPPILVVGTTQDPATPYAWAQALASQLSRGVLLTRVGQDHVAIFYSSCVRGYDDVYLVSVVAPPAGTVCR